MLSGRKGLHPDETITHLMLNGCRRPVREDKSPDSESSFFDASLFVVCGEKYPITAYRNIFYLSRDE